MRVTFAGGVGEHGRNCFLVEGETLSFLVDCGRMAGAQDPYPALTAAQARGLDCVFNPFPRRPHRRACLAGGFGLHRHGGGHVRYAIAGRPVAISDGVP